MKNIVLLSTYNGEKYLKDQLDSLLSQSVMPSKIFIRDDGSTDSTKEIIIDYCQRKKRLFKVDFGENIGVTKSFFSLINDAPKGDYYFLCDQDDVWFDYKIERANEVLSKYDNTIPTLYIGRFILTDEKLKKIDYDLPKVYSYTDFCHSLMYHSGSGNTFCFNEAARKEIMKFDFKNCKYGLHDSLIHKIIAMKGKVIVDDFKSLYYRQHGDNLIGIKSFSLEDITDKIRNFTSGRSKNYRSLVASEILDNYHGSIDTDKFTKLVMLSSYTYDRQMKHRLLRCKCFNTDLVHDVLLRILTEFNLL